MEPNVAEASHDHQTVVRPSMINRLELTAGTASVAQCNADTYPAGAGYQVTCTLTVVNTITAAGAESSVVTATACLAAAGVLPPSG